jgi:peptidoglycan/xylan/chitin deacetylase (PgdA/CDA1 family)
MSSEWVCLMYHDVATECPPTSGGRARFSVSATSFARHLALIGDAGLRGCSIAEASANPGHRIAISFDDGDLGQHARAFPALAASGMTATFFITTGWVGRPGFVSWDGLREMRDAGMAIESHTHTHPFLSELSESALRDELQHSRDLLLQHLGQQPTMISLPGGDFPREELRKTFAEEGYSVIATSRWGVNRNLHCGNSPFMVQRCTVRGELPDERFLAIAHADRWLRVRKRTRESTLALVRRILGPSRYAERRRSLLNAAGALRH